MISIWNANPTWPTSAADPFLPNKDTKIMLVEKAPSVLQRTSYTRNYYFLEFIHFSEEDPSTISGWAGGGCSYPSPNTPRFRFRSCCFAHSPFVRLWIHSNSLVANTMPRYQDLSVFSLCWYAHWQTNGPRYSYNTDSRGLGGGGGGSATPISYIIPLHPPHQQ